MLTLGQAARLGTVPATGPAVRHATPDVTDAELRHCVSRAEENLIELHSALEGMRSQRDACQTLAQALNSEPARRSRAGEADHYSWFAAGLRRKTRHHSQLRLALRSLRPSRGI